mmetsp:Transcript_80836/g.223609  ORF Transcript_80836/g.223609 Transcript_80836/m.223609 type:complete len:133 (+) Transcript_80836:417-815(+)
MPQATLATVGSRLENIMLICVGKVGIGGTKVPSGEGGDHCDQEMPSETRTRHSTNIPQLMRNWRTSRERRLRRELARDEAACDVAERSSVWSADLDAEVLVWFVLEETTLAVSVPLSLPPVCLGSKNSSRCW